MESHTKTYNGFSGVDINTTEGLVVQGVSYTVSRPAAPIYADGKQVSTPRHSIAGTLIFRDSCETLPTVFDIELTGCNELGQVMKKYLRGCELIDEWNPKPDTEYKFTVYKIEDWASVKPPKPTPPPEWPPWGIDSND